MAALIHKDSAACTKSELDLFIMPPTQTVVERGQFIEYHPLANIKDDGPAEFFIPGNGEEYIDLGSSYIFVKVKIVKSDGKPLLADDPVAPVNLLLHSLFSQVDVSLNERIISSSTNTYPYRAYLETLLNYGEDAKKTLLSCQGFFKDTHLDETDPIAGDNIGLRKRYEWCKLSRTMDLIGPLHCDMFQQNRLLLNLVDVKIKMIRSKPSFFLMSKVENIDYKVVLEHASLFVRKVKVSSGVLLGHVKALEKSSAKYPIDRVLCKTYSISQGSWSFMQDNVFLGTLPKRVVIACVKNSAMSGQYTLNPFLFEHCNMNFLSVYVDGQPVTSKPMELNFENNNYVRAYHSLFCGFNNDRGIDLTRDEFAKGHTIYAYNLNPDMCEGGHLNLQRQGNLRVEMKFSQALKETVTVLIYAEFENVIEISKARHVLCDFAN